MKNRSFLLTSYAEEDLALMDVDALAGYASISRSFIRLCLTQGCPHVRGRMSQAMLLEWLFRNYEGIRSAAGLAPMASIEGVAPEAALALGTGNALLTLLEYTESRTSATAGKARLRKMHDLIAQAMDEG